MARHQRVVWLAALLLALSPLATAAPHQHGPVHYSNGPVHQHGPVHYGNGADDRHAPGAYRTHREAGSPYPLSLPPRTASPVIIVSPLLHLDRHARFRFHRPHRRRPGHGESIHRGDSPWRIEDGTAPRRLRVIP